MHSIKRNAAAEARGVPETDQLGRVNRENSLASGTVEGQRGGHRSRAKGDRIEREIVSRHAAIGVRAPLAGALVTAGELAAGALGTAVMLRR
jgi:hypothetical protein